MSGYVFRGGNDHANIQFRMKDEEEWQNSWCFVVVDYTVLIPCDGRVEWRSCFKDEKSWLFEVKVQ